MPNTYACKGVFNPIFPPNSAEGLHFSAFHCSVRSIIYGLSEHAILAVRAIISITKDAIVLSVRFAAIIKRRFS